MIDNKITIKDDEKVNIQRGAIGHRSTWTGLTYKYAAEAGKAEEAEKIIRQAISETGRVQGNALREQCPGILTHLTDTVFCLPAKLPLCLGRICVTLRHIACAALLKDIVDL